MYAAACPRGWISRRDQPAAAQTELRLATHGCMRRCASRARRCSPFRPVLAGAVMQPTASVCGALHAREGAAISTSDGQRLLSRPRPTALTAWSSCSKTPARVFHTVRSQPSTVRQRRSQNPTRNVRSSRSQVRLFGYRGKTRNATWPQSYYPCRPDSGPDPANRRHQSPRGVRDRG